MVVRGNICPSFDSQIYKAPPPLSANCNMVDLVRWSTIRADPGGFVYSFVGEDATTDN